MTTINTAPVIAQCYGWGSGDDIDAHQAGDAGGSFDLDNVKDRVLWRSARTADATDPGGFEWTLATQTAICCAELVNTEALAGEQVTWEVSDVSPFVSGTVVDTSSAWPQREDEIWTDADYTLHRTAPVRSNILLGYDNFTGAGPTPAATPTVATVNAKSGRITFSTAGAGRSYWRAAFLGLGINGLTLPPVESSNATIRYEPIALNSGVAAQGGRWTLRYEWLSSTAVEHITAIWQRTAEGTFPAFFFPAAGQRTTAGIITGTTLRPSMRGGLVRLKDWTFDWAKVRPDGAFSAATLVAESWQEVPA
jgi:hypothetical protein